MDEVTTESASGAPLPPGVCIPWEQKLQELGAVVGDPEIIRRRMGAARRRGLHLPVVVGAPLTSCRETPANAEGTRRECVR